MDERGDVKLLRGEDRRCSGHNAATVASDLIRRAWWAEGWGPIVFGHDLQNTYRQWAVKHPGPRGVPQPVSRVVVPLRHVLRGGNHSVWNFLQAAVAVQARPGDPADSSWPLRRRLRCRLRFARRSRPAKEHVVQGVDLSLNPRWSYCGHCEAPGPHLDIASGNRTWLRAWPGYLTFLSQAIWMYE